jgi:hypothetical protein
MGTSWDYSILRRVHYFNEARLDEILLRLHHLDVDRFAGKCPIHERNAPIAHPRKCIAARHQALNLHSFHSREL